MKKTVLRLAALVLFAAMGIAVMVGAGSQKPVLSGEAIYKNCADAVFFIRSLNEDGSMKTTGSGFVIGKSGLALTASHVIRGAASISVFLPGGEELKNVPVVDQDDMTDISVLQLPEREGGYSYLLLSEEAPVTGETVYTIGYPAKNTKIMNSGIIANPLSLVNNVRRTLVTADLASGTSGGPMISQYGLVIGINSATLKTMNGISVTPTLEQIKQTVEGYPDGVDGYYKAACGTGNGIIRSK